MTRTFNTLTSCAFAIALALAMPTAASAEWMDEGWPNADIAVMGVSFTSVPTVFDALGTADGDTGGLQFEFDYDNDGVYDELTEDAVGEHTYDDVGPHTATLRVTDPEFEVSSVASVTFEVVDISEIGPPLSPSDGALPATGVTVDRHTVAPGGTLTLVLASGEQPAGYTARLVKKTADDPWFSPAAQTFSPLKGEHAGSLTVNGDMKPGDYELLITAPDNTMASFTIAVTGSEKLSAATSKGPDHSGVVVPLSIAGGLLALLAAALLIAKRRRAASTGSDAS